MMIKLSDHHWSASFLFCTLLALYLCTYAPVFHASDGQAMFATAESLARHGEWHIEQIRWMGLQQGTYGLDGLLYSRKGLGQPLLALPLTWLGLILPQFGPATTTLLFGSIITAFTGVLILWYLVCLGYRNKTALLVGLIYGTATMAWPYAKTFFSDTLAGTLLLISLLGLLLYQQRLQHRYLFLSGLSLAWAVATRYAEAVFLPVFGLLLLAYLWTNYQKSVFHFQLAAFTPPPSAVGGRRSIIGSSQFVKAIIRYLWQPILAFMTPIVAIGLALMVFNYLRYGDPFNTGYLAEETFSAVWWQGIAGQLFSPGRGLFLYNPILLLSLFGLNRFWRNHKAEATTALAVILIHLLLYGKWFMWHGGFAWGPRFMVATLPFWAILLAPVIEGWESGFYPEQSRRVGIQEEVDKEDVERDEDSKERWSKGWLYGLWLISFVMQIPGVAVDFDLWQNQLLETRLLMFDPITFFDPIYSPLLQTWAFISIKNLDVAWVYEGQIAWGLVAILGFNLVLAIGITSLYVRKGLQNTPPFKWATMALMVVNLGAVVMLLQHVHNNQPPDLKDALAIVNQSPEIPILYHNPEKATTIAELYTGNALVLGLWTAETDHLATMAATSPAWWWLNSSTHKIETYLRETHGIGRQEQFGNETLILFAKPERPVWPTNFHFEPSIDLIALAHPADLHPQSPLPIELVWQISSPLTTNYHIFLHLLDAEGSIVAQSDGQPLNWLRPTSTWTTGEGIIDYHALWLPNLPAGNYTLIAGLYLPETGDRLLTSMGEDFVTLKTFAVP